MPGSNGYSRKVARHGYFVAEPNPPQGWRAGRPVPDRSMVVVALLVVSFSELI